jgi:pyruvate dehydrogenase E1 component
MSAGELADLDPIETEEWRDALKAVQQHRGAERATYLVGQVVEEAPRDGVYVQRSLTNA